MNITDFYKSLKAAEDVLKNKGLAGEVVGRINWCGEEFAICVTAWEYGASRYDGWNYDRRFEGKITDAAEITARMQDAIYAIPPREDRDLQHMLQKLGEIIDELPKGHSEAAQAAWESIRQSLRDRSNQLASYGLPSPAAAAGIREIR